MLFSACSGAEAAPSCCHLPPAGLVPRELFCPRVVDDLVSPSGSALKPHLPTCSCNSSCPSTCLPGWQNGQPRHLLPSPEHQIWNTGDLWGHQAELGDFGSNRELGTYLWVGSEEAGKDRLETERRETETTEARGSQKRAI